MQHSFKTLTSLLVVLVCCTASFAQVRQPDFTSYGGSIPAKINGVIQVSAFDYDVPSDFASAVGSWLNFSNGCSYTIPGYGSNQPFSSSAKVTITDLTTSANTETVTVSAVNTAAPNCIITTNAANSHTGKWRMQSGTCGLKEAILLFGGSVADYEVGQAFYDRGCNASTITGANATGAASGSVLVDKSNGVFTFYVSNGTNFVKQSAISASGWTGGAISNGAAVGVGYATGAGCAVTQATSKSTGVTCNGMTGAITMNNASLAATTSVAFTVTNSSVLANDVIIVNLKSGNTANSYTVMVDATAAGSFNISLRNYTAGALGEAVIVSFAIIRGATS